MTAHGHTSTAEIVAAVGGDRLGAEADETQELSAKIGHLESELSAERKTRSFLEREVTELQNGLTRLLHRWRDDERKLAILQRRLDHLGEPNERLMAATREGVKSLQALRAERTGSDRGAKELAEHVRRMRAIVEAVQAVREASKVAPAERTAVTARDSAGRRA